MKRHTNSADGSVTDLPTSSLGFFMFTSFAEAGGNYVAWGWRNKQ
jgi:hypothetical protein